MGNLWKLDIFVSIYYKAAYVDTAGNNICVFGKVIIDDTYWLKLLGFQIIHFRHILIAGHIVVIYGLYYFMIDQSL